MNLHNLSLLLLLSCPPAVLKAMDLSISLRTLASNIADQEAIIADQVAKTDELKKLQKEKTKETKYDFRYHKNQIVKKIDTRDADKAWRVYANSCQALEQEQFLAWQKIFSAQIVSKIATAENDRLKYQEKFLKKQSELLSKQLTETKTKLAAVSAKIAASTPYSWSLWFNRTK